MDELFPGQDPVGTRIRIGTVPFDVIGVLLENGQSTMGNDQDDIIFVPSTTAIYRMGDGETVHDIMASAVSEPAVDRAHTEIASLLRRTHRIASGDEDDFEIRNQIGIFTGIGIAFGLDNAMGTHVILEPSMMFISVGFTAVVGVFFGYYPTKKASALNPIDAMRYE